jgi:hypothetical protein
MAVETKAPEGRLARLGVALAAWSERCFPDPLVFAFLGIVLVFLLAPDAGYFLSPANLAKGTLARPAKAMTR